MVLWVSRSLLAIFLVLFTASCGMEEHHYSIDPSLHPWLTGARIAIDPGHGGTSEIDPFRTYNGVNEEEINLIVARHLSLLLKKAGAEVLLTRRSDRNVPMDDRIDAIGKFNPDLLISIHHNGSPRRMDDVNYPLVLIWGTPAVRPASVDFATILLKELEDFTGEKGLVLSDFSIFPETGTRILRETRYLCPGVLGEGCFFSHDETARELKDPAFLIRESEAYFLALSEWGRRGIPEASVSIAASPAHNSFIPRAIDTSAPEIHLHLQGDRRNRSIGVYPPEVTLDDVPVKIRKEENGSYKVLYGEKIHGGSHRIRFRFRNLQQNRSMIYETRFAVIPEKGEFLQLYHKGKNGVYHCRGAGCRRALLALQSALSLGVTDPLAPEITKLLALGYQRSGDPLRAKYYKEKVLYFLNASYNLKGNRNNDYRYPVEYYGKECIPTFTGESHRNNGASADNNSVFSLFRKTH